MAHHTISSGPSDSLRLPWSWCALTALVRFRVDALAPHPATLTLCPYLDCSTNALRDGWRWATIQREHPDNPLQLERNMVYKRGGMGSSQAHRENTPAAS